MFWRVFLLIVIAAYVRGKDELVYQDWWETAVIYQIYPRSFMDSDGDGIGDINGITSRLDYLKELGVQAAWLGPIFKSPMHDFGFDVSDYYSINPEYGSMDDFEQLLKKATELNIKVILEMVPNHTSNESDWFLKSANRDEYYSDWYIWENGHIDERGNRQPPNNWISVFRNSAWTYAPNRDQYYLHHFFNSQPDLNFRNPVVVDEIKSIMKFWLEKGVAGLSINAVNYLFEVDKDLFGGHFPDEPLTGKPRLEPYDYGYLEHVYTRDQEEVYDMVSQFRVVFDAITVRDNMTRVLMTEANTGIKNAVRYYGGGYRMGAHIPMNFGLIKDLNKGSDARDIKYAIDKWLSYKPLKKPANWVIGNHDKSRVSSRFRAELVDAFNMLILLLPGVAITYMGVGGWEVHGIVLPGNILERPMSSSEPIQADDGEELGMPNGYLSWVDTKDTQACNTEDPSNYMHYSRDPSRTPFQWSNEKHAGFSTAEKSWLPVADGYERLNVANQRSAVRSHYQNYRILTQLRQRPAFKLGRYESLALNTDVFAFKRWYNDDAYIMIMNLGRVYHVVNLTAFDLIFGQLEVECSSVQSSRTYSDNVSAEYLDLAADEALVLRMAV